MKRLLLASAALVLPHPAFAQTATPAAAPIAATCGAVVEGQAATCSVTIPTPDDNLVNGTHVFTVPNVTASITLTDNDKACDDGSIILTSAVCPAVALTGAPAIASPFDYHLAIKPTTHVSPSAAPDVVGAFRFICGAGQVLPDDPIVYPGQPGKSHLHQFYGNTSVNASSTFKSLRTADSQSTCNNGPHSANHSGYWMPAMLDGVGHVVQPDYVSIYYKRRPASDPKCSLTSGDTKAEGNCVGIPNGLKFIMGFNMLNPAATPTGSFHYNCQGPAGQGAVPGTYKTLADAIAHCPYVPGAVKQNQLGAVINAPDCWDGKHLDSADHRSHVAYAFIKPGTDGARRCPLDHPFVIPDFTLGAWYSVDANLAKWHLSSDEMVPGTAPGSTFHADYFEGWDPAVKAMWEGGCINKMLNCSAGELGNGYMLNGASQPAYGWINPNHIIPVPAGGM